MKHGSRGTGCVCTRWICAHTTRMGPTHTEAHTTWLDICTNERALVDSAGVPGWGWISHHKIPPIFKVPVWLEVMFSISVASLGLSYHHCCIYWQPCFIFCLGCPQNCLCSILYRLETSLLSLAWVLKVPFSPAKGNRTSWFYPPVCNRDLWTAQWFASHTKSIIITEASLFHPTSYMQSRIMCLSAAMSTVCHKQKAAHKLIYTLNWDNLHHH